MNNEYYLDERHKILYSKNNTGNYEPVAVNFDKVTMECELIQDIPYLLQLVEYVNFVRRSKDARDGKYRNLPLFVYQWSVIIDVVMKTINPNSDRVLNTWSRQSKQTWTV